MNRLAVALLAAGVIALLLVASKADGRPTPLTTLYVSQQTFEPVEQQEFHWNFTGCQQDPDDFRYGSGSGVVAGAATVWAGCINADWQDHLISAVACGYKDSIKELSVILEPPADPPGSPWPYSVTRIPYTTGTFDRDRRISCRWACMGTPDYDRSDPRLAEIQPAPRLVGVRTQIWITIWGETGNRGAAVSAYIVPSFRLPSGALAYCRMGS